MSDPTVALQKAISDRLKLVLPSLNGVFDYVPESAKFPYATLSALSSQPIDEECWDRSEVYFQIDIWSSDTSSRPVKTMAATARDALHEVEFPVSGFVIDRIRVDGVFVTREEQTLLNRARIVVAAEAQPI